MVVGPDTIVVDVEPRDISLETFVRAQERAGSPAAASAASAYVQLATVRVSINFLLAVFNHESTMATNPAAIVVRYDTANPGNCRTSRTGVFPVVQTPRGQFVDYPTWEDGWNDLAYRLIDPTYVYVTEGRRTIRQIIERFAPASDNNVPSSYIAAVVADMNRWLEVETVVSFEMPASINGIPVRKSFIPATNRNRPGTPANAEGRRWITVHETGNPSRGADAEMHRKYCHNGGGMGGENDGVSFTFVVDDHEIVWLVPLEEKTWQASDGANGTGNSSISIETCVNVDGNWQRAQEVLAQLVAYLATNVPGRSLDRIAQHHDWARDQKNCPTRLRANGEAGWTALIVRVNQIAAGASPRPPVPEPPLVQPGNPNGEIPIIEGFKSWCETLGQARFAADMHSGILSICGWALEPEFTAVDGCAYQRFERLTLQWTPNTGGPFDIVPLRLGDTPPAQEG